MVHLWIQPGWIAVCRYTEMLPASILNSIWIAWPRKRWREAKGSEGIWNSCPCRRFISRADWRSQEFSPKMGNPCWSSALSIKIAGNSNDIATVFAKTSCCQTLEITSMSLPKSFLKLSTKGCRHRLFQFFGSGSLRPVPPLWNARTLCSNASQKFQCSFFALWFSWRQRFWPLMRIGQRWKGKR